MQMSLDLIKANLILTFITGRDEYNEPIYSKVTISSIRKELTANEIHQVVQAFQSLVSHTLFEAQVVYTNVLYPA